MVDFDTLTLFRQCVPAFLGAFAALVLYRELGLPVRRRAKARRRNRVRAAAARTADGLVLETAGHPTTARG